MEHLTAFSSTVTVLLCVFFIHIADAFSEDALPPSVNPSIYGFEIIERYRHDPQSFTQGLVFDEEFLYEGTGKYGQSRLIAMFLDGSNVQVRSLAPHLFGEGITVFGDDIVQLTWKSRTGIVWDKKNLQVKRIFHYPTEGWGITHDGQWLIMSDGSATLFFLDPSTYTLHHRITVTDEKGPVRRLNELEYIKGEIWANIWQDDRIARIDPKSGKVTGWIDFARLVKMAAPPGPDNVLNGIAYDKENNRIFITGKQWSQLFEIRVILQKDLPHPVPLLK